MSGRIIRVKVSETSGYIRTYAYELKTIQSKDYLPNQKRKLPDRGIPNPMHTAEWKEDIKKELCVRERDPLGFINTIALLFIRKQNQQVINSHSLTYNTIE
jgi:hypothetical protein